MSNKSRRLYTGFTNDLARRVIEHKEKIFPSSFTAQYVYDMLVFYEEYSRVVSAKMREKEIKGWRREKKLKLILAENPDWADLSLNGRKIRDGNSCPKPVPALNGKLFAIKIRIKPRMQQSRFLGLTRVPSRFVQPGVGLGMVCRLGKIF